MGELLTGISFNIIFDQFITILIEKSRRFHSDLPTESKLSILIMANL